MLVKNYRILLEQFYCLHATADGNWHTQITEKVLLNSANYSISIVRSKQTLHKITINYFYNHTTNSQLF